MTYEEYKALPNNMDITGYVQDCEHRDKIVDTQIVNGVRTEHIAQACSMISKAVGAGVYVNPAMCAKCRLFGEIDGNFMSGNIHGFLLSQLESAVLGFHKGQAHVADLLSRLMACRALLPEQLKLEAEERTHRVMVDLVGLSRLGIDRVKELALSGGYKPEHDLFKHLAIAHENRSVGGVMQAAQCCGKKPPEPGFFDKALAVVKTGAHVAGALLGPDATEAQKMDRMAKCNMCMLKDSAGNLLFRGGDNPTCGVPWLNKMARDEKKDGCGCSLKLKWGAANEKCPNGAW